VFNDKCENSLISAQHIHRKSCAYITIFILIDVILEQELLSVVESQY